MALTNEWVSKAGAWIYKWPFNSLGPGDSKVTFKLILMIDSWGIACEVTIRWMSQDLTDDMSTLVQVMAYFLMAASHYWSGANVDRDLYMLPYCGIHELPLQSRGCLMGGGPLWPPTMPRLAARSSQQTPPGGLGQRFWSVSKVTWPPNLEFQGWGS